MDYPYCLLYTRKPKTDEAAKKSSETPKKVTSWRGRRGVPQQQKQTVQDKQNTRQG